MSHGSDSRTLLPASLTRCWAEITPKRYWGRETEHPAILLKCVTSPAVHFLGQHPSLLVACAEPASATVDGQGPRGGHTWWTRQAAAHITGVKADVQGQSLYTLPTVREKNAAVTSEQGWPVPKLVL